MLKFWSGSQLHLWPGCSYPGPPRVFTMCHILYTIYSVPYGPGPPSSSFCRGTYSGAPATHAHRTVAGQPGLPQLPLGLPVHLKGGPQHRSEYSMILTRRTPKEGPCCQTPPNSTYSGAQSIYIYTYITRAYFLGYLGYPGCIGLYKGE